MFIGLLISVSLTLISVDCGCVLTKQSQMVDQPTYPNFQCGKRWPDPESGMARHQVGRHRIVGGKKAIRHSWPWAAFLSIGDAFCGATLIQVQENTEESKLLVTAAHCVTKNGTWRTSPKEESVTDMYVLIGVHDVRHYSDDQRYSVDRVIFHEDFVEAIEQDAYSYYNDIALVILKEPVKFTRTVQPICLPKQGQRLPPKHTCVAAGWGRRNIENPKEEEAEGEQEDDSEESPTSLYEVELPISDPSECLAKSITVNPEFGEVVEIGELRVPTNAIQEIERQKICSATYRPKGAHFGDSGGMFACSQGDQSRSKQNHGLQWTLYGVLSETHPVRASTTIGFRIMSTRTSNYADWIVEKIQTIVLG